MIELDAATVMIQWAAGGLVFLWATTRRREVGLGYGWTQRIVFISFGIIALVISRYQGWEPARDILNAAMIVASSAALWQSYQRRSAGVKGQREVIERRSERVAEMTGIDRDEQRFDKDAPEFDPRLDIPPAVFGMLACVAAGLSSDTDVALSLIHI